VTVKEGGTTGTVQVAATTACGVKIVGTIDCKAVMRSGGMREPARARRHFTTLTHTMSALSSTGRPRSCRPFARTAVMV
jgi:hypothetical protein